MICKDCKSWKGDRAEYLAFGECAKLAANHGRNQSVMINSVGLTEGLRGRGDFTAVLTISDFGCVGFEPVLRCPQCGDDRTGKGSLILWPDAYCDERCYELYKEAQNSGEDSHHE